MSHEPTPESGRVTDGGVTVYPCAGCHQDTIYRGLCSDCQVDVQCGKPAGTHLMEAMWNNEPDLAPAEPVTPGPPMVMVHSWLCGEITALLDLTGPLRRHAQYQDNPSRYEVAACDALGKVRELIADAESLAHADCKYQPVTEP